MIFSCDTPRFQGGGGAAEWWWGGGGGGRGGCKNTKHYTFFMMVYYYASPFQQHKDDCKERITGIKSEDSPTLPKALRLTNLTIQ